MFRLIVILFFLTFKINNLFSIIKKCLLLHTDLVPSRRTVFVQEVYMAVRDEHPWENVRRVGGSIPNLTVKQAKILTLFHLVEREKNFENIIQQFLEFVRYNLLSRKPVLSKYKSSQLANLSRMFVALCKLKGND